MIDALPADMAGLDPFDLLDQETLRVDRFYSSLAGDQWLAATRCSEWNRLQLLAHLAAIEDYTRAGLADQVTELMTAAPSTGMDELNQWGVALRADRSPQQLLEEWRALSAQNRRELRRRGVDGSIDTAAGPYPLGRQTYYLASELAIHGDDAGVVTPADERAPRLAWRVRFARVAIAEVSHGVFLRVHDGGQTVRVGNDEAFLSDETLVEGASGRLPAGLLPPALQKALVALA
jgi:uncharacterized protein (TIGR03083 family)